MVNGVAETGLHVINVWLTLCYTIKKEMGSMEWCIFGVIPYLTAIGGRYAVQYSRKRDD